MRDVAFYYRKKTGVPKMRDSGLADVLVPGDGMTVRRVLFCNSHLSHTNWDIRRPLSFSSQLEKIVHPFSRSKASMSKSIPSSLA